MISFTITTDKGVRKVSAPNSWEEITYEQLVKIETDWDGKDLVHLFGILIEVELEILSESTDKGLEEILYRVCNFVFSNTPDWAALKRPKRLTYKGRVYKIPSDIRNETLAQKVMINGVLKSDVSVIDAIPKAVAIYMFREIHKGSPIDPEKIDQLSEELRKQNAITVYSIGNFFLNKLKKYQRVMLRDLVLRSPTRLKSSRTQRLSLHMKTLQ